MSRLKRLAGIQNGNQNWKMAVNLPTFLHVKDHRLYIVVDTAVVLS